jgi:suppressor of fused
MPEADPEAVGWQAIDDVLQPLYGTTEPLHYAPPIHASLGGPDPLDGISIYRSGAFGDHWHYVTYGFTELYDKETEDEDVSGYGFELTFRLRALPGEETPPSWPLNLLQNLARYVFSSGNVFEAAHYMDLHGPIMAGGDTAIRAIAFAHDPQLPREITTPNGRAQFLQVIGVTLDELSTIKRWNAETFLQLAAEQLPGLVTDLDRPSLLDTPSFAAAVERGVQQDGSSTALLFPSVLSWEETKELTVTLGANAVRDVMAVLPARVPFGRELMIATRESQLMFVARDAAAWSVIEGNLVIALAPADARDLARELAPKAGQYRIAALPDVVFQVEKSPIKDREGNIVDWIG